MERLFGLHAIHSLLATHPKTIQQLYCLEGRSDHRMHTIVVLAEKNNIPLTTVSRLELDKMVNGNHQGIVAECSEHPTYHESDLECLLAEISKPLLLVLDSVTDPHNLGACLRSADAAGVDAIIIPKDKAATVNATVRKVACGAAESVPIITVTNLARVLRQLKDAGIWLYGLAGEAQESIYKTDLTGNVAIVMGGEGSGLRRLTRDHCDYLVNIPMLGHVNSLNVSVAAGVALFEVVRQRSN